MEGREEPELLCDEGAEALLWQLRAARIRRDVVQQVATQEVEEARAAEGRALRAIDAEIKEMEGKLLAWAASRRDPNQKVLRLMAGSIRWRRSPPKVTLLLPESEVIARLRACGQHHCIVTAETLDLNQVKRLPRSVWASAGITVGSHETVAIQTELER